MTLQDEAYVISENSGRLTVWWAACRTCSLKWPGEKPTKKSAAEEAYKHWMEKHNG